MSIKACNIDLLVAGCNTNCRHCYVDGGPAPHMPLHDVEYLFLRLREVHELLLRESFSISVTLDNEPANHPDALTVWQWAEWYLKPFYYHHGSTTGISFIGRSDRHEILIVMQKAGWNDVSFAVHGAEDNHNVIVQKTSAFQAMKEAAKLFHEHAFNVGVSLMLSKSLIEDQDQIKNLISELAPAFTMMVVPLHVPNKRMNEYLKWRPTLKESLSILPTAREWNIDVEKLSRELHEFHLHKIIQHFLKTSFEMIEWPRSREVAYYSVRPNLDLYYGNTGDERERLGNIRELSNDDIVMAIKSWPANDIFFDHRVSGDQLKTFYEHINEDAFAYPDWVFPDLDSALCCLADLLL